MRRTLLTLFSIFAITSTLITSACTGAGAKKEAPTPTPLPKPAASAKQTFTVQRGDINAQMTFSARVIPAVQEELSFRANGRVRKVYIRGGDIVTKGQVLADLNQMDEMESQKRSQDLTLRRAQINLEMAWLRQQQAATQTPQWSGNYEIEMKMEEYQVELAQIALEETKLNAQNLDGAMADAQIVSPIDGKVLQIQLIEGKEVNAFQELITVGDDSQLEIGSTLTAAQMQLLAEAMPATMELSSRPGEKLTGSIRSLPYPYGTGGGTSTSDSSPATDKTKGDNTTRVVLDNPADTKGFRLGDIVQVTVVMESKQGVLYLPPAAIRTFEGRNFVVVQTDGLPRRADIKVGIKNEERVEVTEGLEEGQVIIAP
jgi:membrane fusion protein, macrolide-specific efflux system